MSAKPLFVYGIFLDEVQRSRYGMSNPRYATVKDYATYGSHIVMAYKQKGAGLALSGLLVDVAPTMYEQDNWARLDSLEYGYERKIITTVNGIQAYMYVGKE